MQPKIDTKPVNINNIKIGSHIRNYYLCIRKTVKTTKNQNKYVDLILKNKYGAINGKIWRNVNSLVNLFNTNDIVAVKGVCDEFNSIRELNISSINKVSDGYYDIYGFDSSNIFVRRSSIDSISFKKMSKYFKYIDGKYHEIIVPIYNDFFKFFSIIPLTLSDNYSFESGYMLYIWRMLLISDNFKNQSCIKHSMLVTCILIHEIGKIKYFDCSDGFRITKAGQTLGSAALGLALVNDYGAKIQADEKSTNRLCNIILYFEKLFNQVENKDISLEVFESQTLYNIHLSVINDD